MCLGSIKPEVESHTLKFIVGVIGISLATVTNFFSEPQITSISASYQECGWFSFNHSKKLISLFTISCITNQYCSASKLALEKDSQYVAQQRSYFPLRLNICDL
jgi:uncharacterized protein with PQ loop repeat